ncbi:MAG: hypothetical protein N3Z28_08645 [Synechococcaceae cyanobacterium MAG-AL2]|uniref:hypothetical protein n=1 Tax=Candidatus Regnicoccus frigidus TaxID=3074015 RepID=UPI00281F7160|nr:hypothetical protein [Candidatus Regnicoccus frigidus]MCT4367719.1 hypothetical protein [Candidatus Regnicoccus frigidus MAG-AL2]
MTEKGWEKEVGLGDFLTSRQVRLLKLTGHRLEAHRCRIDEERARLYRVVAEPLPAGSSCDTPSPATGPKHLSLL